MLYKPDHAVLAKILLVTFWLAWSPPPPPPPPFSLLPGYVFILPLLHANPIQINTAADALETAAVKQSDLDAQGPNAWHEGKQHQTCYGSCMRQAWWPSSESEPFWMAIF